MEIAGPHALPPAAQLDSGRQDDGALPGGTGAQTLASSSKVFIYWRKPSCRILVRSLCHMVRKAGRWVTAAMFATHEAK